MIPLNYCMDIYRILVNHAPVFADCRPEVEWHIPHDYTEEMSRKSHVVSCIILINICLNLAVYSLRWIPLGFDCYNIRIGSHRCNPQE